MLLPEDAEPTMFPATTGTREIPQERLLTWPLNGRQDDRPAVPHGILIDGKLQEEYEIMYDYSSHPDGSLLYHFQIPMVHASREYTIRLRLNNWEVTHDGAWLREEPHDTWLKDDWTITIRPGER